MKYTFAELLEFVPDLKKYIRSKIKTDHWKDIVQDTLLYLFIKFDQLIITNLKGLLFNTANFFINKHFNISKTRYEDINLCFNVTDSIQPIFQIEQWNSNEINDRLLYNLRTIKKTLYEPFEMQLNDKTIKEIGQKLGLKENTVKTRIKRAKEYLKQDI